MEKITLITVTLLITLVFSTLLLTRLEQTRKKVETQVKPDTPTLASMLPYPNYRTMVQVEGAKNPTDIYTFYYTDWDGTNRRYDPKWLEKYGTKVVADMSADLTGTAVLKMEHPSKTFANGIVFMIIISDKNDNKSEFLIGLADAFQ